jgi:hypothetical protein
MDGFGGINHTGREAPREAPGYFSCGIRQCIMRIRVEDLGSPADTETTLRADTAPCQL